MDGRGPIVLMPFLFDSVSCVLFKNLEELVVFGETALRMQILEYGGMFNSLLTFKH